ncbi:hypothetical protein [Methyloversatilis sp.]|uniref:hypothetical protein n=1 Tax=Methyloversatilis sp. TaxID=2569862 RepID=UPI0035AD9A54
MNDIVIKRIEGAGKHKLSLLEHVYVERGDKSDWDALSELHYKGHSLAAGPRFMRCVYEHAGERELIGIMVFSNPMPLNKGRNEVFPHLRPNVGGRDSTMINKRRMEVINRSISWNNRTVLDTMYRSAGIAYRFKNLAYRMYCCKYKFRFVESSSSMGRFNPFSVKAGMKFIKPKPANALEMGVDFFKTHFKSHPCDQVAIMQELRDMPESSRLVIERKLREFYYRHSAMEKSGDKMDLGMTRVNQLDIGYVLRQIAQIVFGATIYWIWENPDHGRTLPDRLPLLAFDRQAVDEPLILEGLSE